jgi:hypothetical protein
MPQARAELARASEQFAVARDELDRAQRPAQRLAAVLAELTAAEQRLVELRAKDEAELAQWLAGGADGPRPSPSDETLVAEQRLARLSRDAGAARSALPGLQAEVDAQNARLGSLAAQRQSALFRSATEAAREYLVQQCRPAMIESLRRLSAVESLVRELNRSGISQPEALSAGREIEQQLFVTRSSLAVRGDMAAAKAFLAELAGNPMAEIPAPQNAEVVHVDPPVIKPMEDGSVYINRGLAEPSPEPVFPTNFGAAEGWAFTPPRGGAV